MSTLFDKATDASQAHAVTVGHTDSKPMWPLRALWNAAGEAQAWVELPAPVTAWSRGHLPGGARKPMQLLPRLGRARTRKTLDIARGPERTYRKSGRVAPGEGCYQTGATRREAMTSDEPAWRTPPAQGMPPAPIETHCDVVCCQTKRKTTSEREQQFHLRRAAQVTGLPTQRTTRKARKDSAARHRGGDEPCNPKRAAGHQPRPHASSHGAAKTSAAHAAACQTTPRGQSRGTWCWRHRRNHRLTKQRERRQQQRAQCLIWAMIAHIWIVPAGREGPRPVLTSNHCNVLVSSNTGVYMSVSRLVHT